MYSIDWDKLISDLLPAFLRKPKMLAWLQVLLTPLQTLYNTFITYRNATAFSIGFTGQTMSLEYLLNYTYFDDGTLRLIYIEDGERREPLYVFQQSENQPAYFHNDGEDYDPVYLYNSEEPTGYDFVVWVPFAFNFPPEKPLEYLISLLNKHKAAGFQFEIKYY